MPIKLADLFMIIAPVDCDVCGHEWEGSWIHPTERIECPACGFKTLTPPVLTAADILDRDRYGDDEDGEACPA